MSFFKVGEFLCSRYRLTRCHNFQFEKHVCEILSRRFQYSSFSRVVSARNEGVFSNITILQLCCRGRQKTETYDRSGVVFIQEPRKFSPIDSNDHQTVFESQLKSLARDIAPEIDLNELLEGLFRTKTDAI